MGIPDMSYVPEDDIKTFGTVLELIEQKMPGIVSADGSVRFSRNEGPPLIVIDGMIDTTELITYIRPEDVLKIDVVKGIQGTMYFGEEGANGFIAIYTNGNTGNQVRKESLYTFKQEIEGFYTARVFYVPNPEQADNRVAVRNTLYWKPFLHPDPAGNASVSFFNTKVQTRVKVAIEGITATGIPVAKNVYYTIKN